jgi:hypothetical protein
MLNNIEKQLLDIGHDPIFFKKEAKELRKIFHSGERIVSFIDGWIDKFNSEGCLYATNLRLIAIAFPQDHCRIEDMTWKSVVRITADINEGLSSFRFISPFTSISVSEIESPFLAKSFYRDIKGFTKSLTVKKQKDTANSPIPC